MSAPGPELMVEMYAAMLRVRLFEERARELFQRGRIPGFLHTSVGQEAVAVGVAAALRTDDYVLSTHRGHGHLVAKGGSLRGLMAELYGKANGICHGKGGTMHIADVSVGYLGANGVLASGCVVAPGVGLSIKKRRSGQVVVTFFGDGAANRGAFHEGVNLSALWTLPVVFVCENNRWASSTAHTRSTAGGSIAARAAGYGIPGESVDGNDVVTVWDAVMRAVERARRGACVYCIGEDIVLGLAFGVTRGLIGEFGPDRVLNAPISEAAIVGSAFGAAVTGLVPVVDMHFADFVTCAMDEVANQIAKSRYMFGGQIDCPITLRMPYGIGRSGGGHHSNSVEAWFVNIPGLKLCIPSTPADAYGLLTTAIRDPDPVLVFEHRGLYRVTGEVGDAETLVPLGSADVKRPGRHVTAIATARMVHESPAAGRRLAEG